MSNDVQKLLNVSSATATRILTSFELKRVRVGSRLGYIKEKILNVLPTILPQQGIK